MVLVFSAHANESPHIPKEIERAVSHGVPIIPLRVEAVMPGKALDYFISSVHWLDAITPPLESHLESLANTVLTLISREGIQVTPPPAPQAVPAPAPPKKKTGLYVGIGVAVLLIAIGFYVSRSEEAKRAEVIDGPQVGLESNPRVKQYRGSAVAEGDPITGCWQWFNNVPVTINPDGRLVAGPFTAQWQRAGQRGYRFTWPEAVDTVTLSGDGNSLSGGNQYGFPTSGTRVAPGVGLAGAWRWPNGAIVMIAPQGVFSVGPFSGRWRASGANTFNLTWPNPVDSVNLSSDSRRIAGHNQYGVAISGTRSSGCGL
jgi:hypothetical protein